MLINMLLAVLCLVQIAQHMCFMPQRFAHQLKNLTEQFNPGNETEELYYIYPLDKEFWWSWPQDESDCSQQGYVGHEHAELDGLGRVINLDDGLFLTWHFSLFNSLFHRLTRSRRRTMDPEKASLFIIPYDLALNGWVDEDTCALRRRCSHGKVAKLEKYLSNSKYFNRHKGKDHVVLWSLGQYHPYPREGCDIFMRSFCQNCTFTCYWMDPTLSGNRFVSIPFPSAFHWWEGIEHLPWAVHPQHNKSISPFASPTGSFASDSILPPPPTPTPKEPDSATSAKQYFAVYLGSTQTLNPAHTKIRRAMTAQCTADQDCYWHQISHNSKDNSLAESLSIYKHSTFCLCPPGDDPARKAVFDSIVSGCIPVIFEVATLYNQYPWHLSEEEALDISVSIPGHLVRSNTLQFMNFLRDISPEVIARKQLLLSLVAPGIQYSIPPLAVSSNTNATLQVSLNRAVRGSESRRALRFKSTDDLKKKKSIYALGSSPVGTSYYQAPVPAVKGSSSVPTGREADLTVPTEGTSSRTGPVISSAHTGPVTAPSTPPPSPSTPTTPPIATSKDTVTLHSWDPPFKDGVDFLVDGLFYRTRRVVADEPVLIPRLEQANKLWSLRYSHCIAKDPASSQYWMEKFKDSDDGLLQHQDFVYKALDAFVVDGVLLPALMESPISKHAHLKHKHQPQT